MAEYMPLMSTSITEHDDEDFNSIKPDTMLPTTSFDVENHTFYMWLTALMAIMAISAAAAFHISMLSTTSGLELIRSRNDITSTLRIMQPSPNLEKGKTYIKQHKLKSKSR
jgi:hypothetical protein